MSSPNKLIIMIGVPGSGKSTRAKEISRDAKGNGYRFVEIVSADDYFIRPDGKYDWSVESLPEAHKWCQENARMAMINHKHWDHGAMVIVDNTNLKRRNFKSYVRRAKEYGYEVEEIVVGKFDIESLKIYAERNVHDVPLESIIRMASGFQK